MSQRRDVTIDFVPCNAIDEPTHIQRDVLASDSEESYDIALQSHLLRFSKPGTDIPISTIHAIRGLYTSLNPLPRRSNRRPPSVFVAIHDVFSHDQVEARGFRALTHFISVLVGLVRRDPNSFVHVHYHTRDPDSAWFILTTDNYTNELMHFNRECHFIVSLVRQKRSEGLDPGYYSAYVILTYPNRDGNTSINAATGQRVFTRVRDPVVGG